MAADWSAQLEKLAKQGGRDLGELCKAVKIELFSEVVSRTRVGNPEYWVYNHPTKGYVDYITWKGYPEGYTGGRLRGNWQIQENAPAEGELDVIDKTGTRTINKIKRKATEEGLTYLVNNLPYAKKWEEEDAMVGRSVVRARRIIRATVKKIKK